jgi:invasion protein IalB
LTGTRITIIAVASYMALTTSQAVHADWNVKKRSDANSQCYLESDSVEMQDGYRAISVRAELDGNNLVIVTPSNVDNSYSDIRVQVDYKAPIKAASLIGKNSVRFSDLSDDMIVDMKKGLKLKAYIRFWPTWPVTKAQPVTFSLVGFTAAYNGLKSCS